MMILNSFIAANDCNFGAQMTERSSCFLAHKFRLNRQSFTCKTTQANFVAFFVLFGNSFFVSSFVTAANWEAILLVTCASRSVRSGVNIPSLSSQSELAKNTIHCFSIFKTVLVYTHSVILVRYLELFNNYSPKEKFILLNNPRVEVEGIIQQYEKSLR